jgi:cyclopropane fatty-acyl-phospholipid synthase-like methyltransferase
MPLPKEKYTSGDYLKNNPTWDMEDSPWKAEKVVELLSENCCNPKSICEIGCGAGGVLVELRRVFPHSELFGYEIARDASHFWSQHASANIHFEVGDFFELNNRSFDLLLLLDVIEHLENPFDFLNRLQAYASFFVFHIPLDLSATNVLRESPLLRSRSMVGHVHYFTKGLALSLLEECGYHVLQWSYSGAAFTSPQQTWKTKLASLPRRLAYSVNKDWGTRLFGGETLMALAQARG